MGPIPRKQSAGGGARNNGGSEQLQAVIRSVVLAACGLRFRPDGPQFYPRSSQSVRDKVLKSRVCK